MFYESTLILLEDLHSKLVFQERRNFFQRKEDNHLIISIKILETILDRIYNNELNEEELFEIVHITSNMISLLNLPQNTINIALNLKENYKQYI